MRSKMTAEEKKVQNPIEEPKGSDRASMFDLLKAQSDALGDGTDFDPFADEVEIKVERVPENAFFRVHHTIQLNLKTLKAAGTDLWIVLDKALPAIPNGAKIVKPRKFYFCSTIEGGLYLWPVATKTAAGKRLDSWS
ncbi:MAG: hypothetical protein KDD43_09780, partial [Bdellovibrionales bacterium]|nr:hypothetical protein [Bdellovibrionales bacterium]